MKAHEFLEKEGMDFQLVEQHRRTKDCDDAARERGVETSQIVKSLIVERHEEKGVTDGELVHVLLPGDREISEKKFGEHHLINPEKSEELTGFKSGTVHPFSTEIHHVIDFRTLEKNRVSFTVGETKRGVIIEQKEFQQSLEKSNFSFEVKDISQTTEDDIEKLKSRGLEEKDARFIADRGLTPQYLEMDYSDEMILKAFRESLRRELEPEIELMREFLEASKDLNHLQKVVEKFAEEDEIPESKDFRLRDVIEEIFEQHPEALEDLTEGKASVENFVIGKVMEETSGQANPGDIKQVLEDEY